MSLCTNPFTYLFKGTNNVFCGQCWWEGAAEDVPYGRDPWDAEGGSLCYCPQCGMVDDLTYKEEK
jgi:hypothetical protein